MRNNAMHGVNAKRHARRAGSTSARLSVMLFVLTLPVFITNGCGDSTVDVGRSVESETQALGRSLDAYQRALDSLWRRTPLTLAHAADSLAQQSGEIVATAIIATRDSSSRAMARYRNTPNVVCTVRIGHARWLVLGDTLATPVCETGSEAWMQAALQEYAEAQARYQRRHRGWAVSTDELDLIPFGDVVTTLLTVSNGGHSAMATDDSVPGLVCAIKIGNAPAPLRDDAEQGVATCGRDSVLAAKAVDRPPPTDTVAAADAHVLAVGEAHVCWIHEDGVVCRGEDRFGQLGDGLTLGRTRPALLVTDVQLRSLWAGADHTCGLDEQGRAYCWGANAHGQLGDATFLDRAVPTAVTGERRFVGLAAGPDETCGLTADGAAYCWGHGTRTPQAISAAVRFRGLASTGCALSAGDELYCWFDRFEAEKGASVAAFRDVVEGIDPLRDEVNACGLMSDDRVGCWRARRYPNRQQRRDSIVPMPVRTPGPVHVVVVGNRHACSLTEEGMAYCWGSNGYGQIGDRTEIDRPNPVAVSTPLRFRTLAARGDRTCGVAEPNGAILCWGGTMDVTNSIPTEIAYAAPERTRGVAADLPTPAPMDTNAHWGFAIPQRLGLHFMTRDVSDLAGIAECPSDIAGAAEGPESGLPIRIQLISGRASLLDLNGTGYAESVFGGFRWRGLIADLEIRNPIENEHGNPTGQVAIDSKPIVSGFVFGSPNACGIGMSYDGDITQSRNELVDEFTEIFGQIRFPVTVDSASVDANARAMTRYRAGQYGEALTEFKHAVALDDGNAEAINNVGFTLYRMGRLEESVTWYRRAIEIDPNRGVAYLNMGDSLEELGYHAEAVAAYEQFLELEPNGAAAERVRAIVR